jgi:hypothetical protein
LSDADARAEIALMDFVPLPFGVSLLLVARRR